MNGLILLHRSPRLTWEAEVVRLFPLQKSIKTQQDTVLQDPVQREAKRRLESRGS